MKNQSKKILEFENEGKSEGDMFVYAMEHGCVESVTTYSILQDSVQNAMSSRVNTLTPQNYTGVCAKMGFTIFPTCYLAEQHFTIDPGPIPVNRSFMAYTGIKSISVQEDGFVLLSPNGGTQIALKPGQTLNNPFNGNEFYIGFKRQGVYPYPTVRLTLKYDQTRLPLDNMDILEENI